jgi:hypothetical protein
MTIKTSSFHPHTYIGTRIPKLGSSSSSSSSWDYFAKCLNSLTPGGFFCTILTYQHVVLNIPSIDPLMVDS